jgi:hypothetical protein
VPNGHETQFVVVVARLGLFQCTPQRIVSHAESRSEARMSARVGNALQFLAGEFAPLARLDSRLYHPL